ncbi:MAG: hypothetical protein U0800_12825 [Isosphaeraceae bacterium]
MVQGSRIGPTVPVFTDSADCGVPILIVSLLLWIPLDFLNRIFEEISGEAQWYREQRQRMECDRPPLPDDAFLTEVAAGSEDATYWLAVRRVMGELIGIPAAAIRPGDRFRDLWRMQGDFPIPDLLDVIFRLERDLGCRIPRSSLEESLWTYPARDFREFAADVVQMLRELSPHRAEHVGG